MNSAVIAAVLPAAACRRSEVLRLEVPRPVAWLAAAHIRDACMRWGVRCCSLRLDEGLYVRGSWIG